MQGYVYGDILNKEKGNDVSYAVMGNPHLDSEDNYWKKVPFEGDIYKRK